MDLQVFDSYIVVIAGLVAIVKGIVDVINTTRQWKSKEGSSDSLPVSDAPISVRKKINALILSIGIVVMLGGIGWMSYNRTQVDNARQQYFKNKDPLLQYNVEFNQKFEDYFNEEYVKPPFVVIGISFILLSLTFFVGSLSRPTTSIFQTTSLLTLEILWFILGIWLVLSNQ